MNRRNSGHGGYRIFVMALLQRPCSNGGLGGVYLQSRYRDGHGRLVVEPPFSYLFILFILDICCNNPVSSTPIGVFE